VAKINKKLLARTSGTTKKEVAGVIRSSNPSKGLYAAAKGGPSAGVKKGSPAAKRATKNVKKYYAQGQTKQTKQLSAKAKRT
jgi:hypothetical protein